MKRRIIIALLLVPALIIMGFAGCSSDDEEETNAEQVFEVKRGDLSITVSADGILRMPHNVALHFGTPGTVEEVLVAEGDAVKAGTLLARLDGTAKRLDIESANCSLQQISSNLVEWVSGSQQVLGYPRFYPDRSALMVFEQAQREVEEAQVLLKQGKYDEAASELRLARYDMESSIKVMEAPVTDTENYPDVASESISVEQDPDLLFFTQSYPEVLETVALVEQDRERLADAMSLIEKGDYTGASSALKTTQKYLIKTHRVVTNIIGKIERRTMSFPDTAISMDFLRSAEERMEEAQEFIEQGDFDVLEFDELLRMGHHDLGMSIAVLENNVLVVEHGLGLKAAQDYNLNLEKAIVDLDNAREEFLNTEILAPFDGVVVAIGVKEDDQLSAQDYTSRTAVHLVDTDTVKFSGIVDEVDIFQVEVGQKSNIIVDALPDDELTGVVTFISPSGTDESGVVTYTVTIELDPCGIKLKGGLTATADIIIESVKNVVMIPTQVIITTPQGQFAEVVIDDITMETERRPIVLGMQSYQFAEVISGLEEGEKVLMADKSANSQKVSESPQGQPKGSGGGIPFH